ncbi:hypothetical protein ES703_08938 [subsurface metagenome]
MPRCSAQGGGALEALTISSNRLQSEFVAKVKEMGGDHVLVLLAWSMLSKVSYVLCHGTPPAKITGCEEKGKIMTVELSARWLQGSV